MIDHDAFERLWGFAEPAVLRMLMAWGRGLDHDEIIQETRVRCFTRNLGLGPFEFRAYAVRTARNLAIEEFRRWRRRGPSWEELGDEQAPSDSSDLLGTMVMEETLSEATARLAQILPDQREVIALWCLGDLSWAQIAALLDITESAAKSRFYQGRRRLGRIGGFDHRLQHRSAGGPKHA